MSLNEGVTTVRVHGFNPTRDLLKLKKQDGEPAWNLDRALKEISNSDRGVLVCDWPDAIYRIWVQH